MCVKTKDKITINEILKIDPTRTLSTRKRFVSKMNKRFALLKKAVFDYIGMDGEPLTKRDFNFFFSLTANATSAQWRSKYDPNKIPDFMGWLEEQNDKFILSKGGSGIEVFSFSGKNWTDAHIRSAYQKGVVRAQTELRKAGADIPSFVDQPSGLSGIFNAPFHNDRVRLAFTQTFEGLKGITKAMDASISRMLAQGMAEGRSPREIAKSIAGVGGEINKIGLNRARTLARTEVIRAHHNANINELERAGIVNVKVKAEWATSGFNVCPICDALEGTIFNLDQIRALIPAHPNCRCIALPIVESDKRFKSKSPKRAPTKVVKGKAAGFVKI
ncbi:MAG: hypothetical protein GY821_12705 [Gammaproteobacteria bacterium]|nr:hypothetical protein [Gammaproteobacteria bacterium]